MKKFKCFLMTVLLLVMSIGLNAQPSKNEITIEYGQFTVPQFAYVFGGVFGVMFSLGHFSFENTVMSGTIACEYNRNVNDWFSYGGLGSFEYMTSDTYTTDGEGVKTYGDKFNLAAATVMPTAHFHWFRNPHFGMYSKIGAGVGLAFSSETSVFPAVQLSPVCIEFGGETLRGIAELGAGMQGIIVVGLKQMF